MSPGSNNRSICYIISKNVLLLILIPENAAFGDVEACPTGTVCSNSADVCVDSSLVDDTTVLDVCGSGANGASCAVCQTNAKYTCVSSTQFARCSSSGVVSTSNVYSCQENEICILAGLTNYNNICVPSCAADFVRPLDSSNRSQLILLSPSVGIDLYL